MKLNVVAFERWNHLISKAISSVSEESFPKKLEAALSGLVDFDICMVFSYSQGRESHVLYHNMDDKIAGIVVDDYLAGPYLLDPFYGAVIEGKQNGFGSMRTLAPDHFTRSQFYRHHYVRTGIADEMGLFFPVSEDKTAVLSVTRQKPRRLFSEADLAAFASAAPMLETFASRHWDQSDRADFPSKHDAPIESVFKDFGKGVITDREREIVRLILKGHSSISIGHVLGISPGTVKNHRKSTYDKLQISSQAELFSLFLSTLEQRLSR